MLDEIGIDHQIFFDVKPDPTLSTINQAMEMIKPYEPDVFISLGGGSPMDAAKSCGYYMNNRIQTLKISQ